MALGKTTAFQTRAFAVVLVFMAGSMTYGPASAQVLWGDRPSGGWGGWGWNSRPSGGRGDRYRSDHHYRRLCPRERPAPAVGNAKGPAPGTFGPPATSPVVVVGDSMADWLGYGLDENYAEQPEIGVKRKIQATSGLVRYDAKNEALDWSQAAQDALSNAKPNAIVVMLGLNDRLPMGDKAQGRPKRDGEPAQGENQSASQASQDKAAAPAEAKTPPQTAAQQPVPSGPYDFHTDQWAALYVKRIDAMIAALKSKGVPVIWVGLPAIRGTKASSDISYLDELYRERVERAGIIYVDIWDGFVDEDGDFAMQGPDFEGQSRRLRTADGVYFTKAGAVKLASYVDRELRRVMPSYVAPVALPGPETTPKSGSASARPDVGPVLPLTSSGGDHASELLGGKDQATRTTSDSIAAKILSRGETLAAPAGRADNFSWPRPGSDASAGPEVSPEPVAAAPGTPEKQGTAPKGNGQNQADTKKDAKEKSASNSRASARVPHRYYNYYSGRHYGWH